MSGTQKVLNLDTMNPCIKRMEYAATEHMTRAAEIEQEIIKGSPKPFLEVIRANIGDCHAMGQQPITFIRQLLALISYPPLLQDPSFPADVKNRAKVILQGCKGGSVGSYSDSPGIQMIRKDVAHYIQERDGGIPSDSKNVYMCAGASEGIKAVMKLLIDHDAKKPTGVMIPIPQYSLYSATIAEFNMHQINYYLDEGRQWALDISELERTIKEAKQNCNPKAIVVINPGNPTGQVLTKSNIEDIIRFALKENLFIFADEVYQGNVYSPGSRFYSFKSVMWEMGDPYKRMELVSFMSCSKGYTGECGIRGGYYEIVNMDFEVQAMHNKSISASLCPTVLGQAVMDAIVNPPKTGEPSYEKFIQEKNAVLQSLAEKAKMITEILNTIQGVSCNPVQGAMFAFPEIKLSQKAIEVARTKKQEPDVFYTFQLLEKTGICVLPGSGFGQKPGTFHFRASILPPAEKLKAMLHKIKDFHENFIKEYA